MEKYAWRGDYKMKRLGDDHHLTSQYKSKIMVSLGMLMTKHQVLFLAVKISFSSFPEQHLVIEFILF